MKKALEPVSRLESRLESAKQEISDLELKLHVAQNQWEESVLAEDPKAEAAAAKRVADSQTALNAARARLPLLAGAVEKARRESLGPHAIETATQLQTLNEQAVVLGHELLTDYERARETATQINALFGEHSGLLRAHNALCAGAQAERVPIPHDAVFAIQMAHLNSQFKPDPESRFRLSGQNLFRPAKLEERDTTTEENTNDQD